MLGWMLKRGDNAPNAAQDGDTTQADVPDTPAPVFAARAFKTALFGNQPGPRDEPRPRQTSTSAANDEGSRTPNSKPQGILLTPGTGTSRPKRVSFGRDVEDGQDKNDPTSRHGGPQKRTRLNEALEKARQKKVGTTNKKAMAMQKKNELSDDDWEEDDDDMGDDNYCHHDITLDLNEPHSQSGRYWKEEFEKYHKDARAEMEKLLKYKQLAKSYAQQKDAEAIDLAEMLKEEQQKVINMEKKIAENASNIISRHENPAEEASPEMVSKLAKQTALAVQYRQRVQELEDELEDFLQEKYDEADGKGRRKHTATSPRTQKTLIETQRELRRARSQVKEMDGLREQVSSLKEKLRAAEKRAAKAEVGARSDEGESSRTKDLRAKLREAKEESRKKDEEIRKLKKDFDQFRTESQKHDEDTRAVLERAHTKIADLKKEIRTLKATEPEQARPRSWHAQSEPAQPSDGGRGDNEPMVTSPAKSRGMASRKTSRGSQESISSGANDGASEAKTRAERRRTLREKYHEGAANSAAESTPAGPKTMSGALHDRPNLDKPKWQPFVPRSPRNRAYLGEEISNRIENGGVTPAGARSKDAGVQDLSTLAKSISSRDMAVEDEEPGIDLLHTRFSRLGGPDVNSKSANNDTPGDAAKSKLPAERRAAAMAKIEQRRVEKQRDRARSGFDKENRWPQLQLFTSCLPMAADKSATDPESLIKDEISDLEARLEEARHRLNSVQLDRNDETKPLANPLSPHSGSSPSHFLLLLSDSALPLGSFAFSSGLESYLAHNSPRTTSFSSFLPSSLSSYASTTLPFVLAAHRNPSTIAELDDELDAAVICTVGRRASVAQGRALLTIWERSFRAALPRVHGDAQVLRDFSTLLRESKGDVPQVSAHLAPLFGAICAIVGLSLQQTAYVFMLSHVKALVSAAVRASMFGPFQAQKILAGENIQRMIDVVIEREWDTPVEEAGQSVPVMDLWIGRHEVLYSRIFNS